MHWAETMKTSERANAAKSNDFILISLAWYVSTSSWQLAFNQCSATVFFLALLRNCGRATSLYILRDKMHYIKYYEGSCIWISPWLFPVCWKDYMYHVSHVSIMTEKYCLLIQQQTSSRGGCRASKGEGTVHICTKCACANMGPRPFSASLEEIVMAIYQSRKCDSFNSQEIGNIDAISAGILYNSGENVWNYYSRGS